MNSAFRNKKWQNQNGGPKIKFKLGEIRYLAVPKISDFKLKFVTQKFKRIFSTVAVAETTDTKISLNFGLVKLLYFYGNVTSFILNKFNLK